MGKYYTEEAPEMCTCDSECCVVSWNYESSYSCSCQFERVEAIYGIAAERSIAHTAVEVEDGRQDYLYGTGTAVQNWVTCFGMSETTAKGGRGLHGQGGEVRGSRVEGFSIENVLSPQEPGFWMVLLVY